MAGAYFHPISDISRSASRLSSGYSAMYSSVYFDRKKRKKNMKTFVNILKDL